MKKFFLIVALVLAVVSSLVAGTMAAYTQHIDVDSGNIVAKQFSIKEGRSASFSGNIKLAPGDKVTYEVTIKNEGEVDTTVNVNGALVAASSKGANTQLSMTSTCDKATGTGSVYSFVLAPAATAKVTFTVTWPYGGDSAVDTKMMSDGNASMLQVDITGTSVNKSEAN